jgi:hypothetical protein
MSVGGSGYSPPTYNPPQTPTVPPGWYPDADYPSIDRWWDGYQWTSHRQTPRTRSDSGPEMKQVVGFVCLALCLVGAAMALFIQVSVLSGTGLVWTGAVLAGVGAIGAGVLKAGVGTRIMCVVLAVAAIASASYDQHQVDKKRHQIEQIFNGRY